MKHIIEISQKTYKEIKERTIVTCGETFAKDLVRRIRNGTPLPKCNECKYYEGVHKVQGHAPCSYHTIGGVMWDWYCSQFEADKESDSE